MMPEHCIRRRQRRQRRLARHLPAARLLGAGVDPYGFVVGIGDDVYRFMHRREAAWLRPFLGSRAASRAVRGGLLSSAVEVPAPRVPGHITLRHGQLPVLGGPHSVDDLLHRGRRVRDLDLLLLDAGVVVDDCNPWNFGGTWERPVWLDWGALRPASTIPPAQLMAHLEHWYAPPEGDLHMALKARGSRRLPGPASEPPVGTREGRLRLVARLARPLPRAASVAARRAWQPVLRHLGRHRRAMHASVLEAWRPVGPRTPTVTDSANRAPNGT